MERFLPLHVHLNLDPCPRVVFVPVLILLFVPAWSSSTKTEMKTEMKIETKTETKMKMKTETEMKMKIGTKIEIGMSLRRTVVFAFRVPAP